MLPKPRGEGKGPALLIFPSFWDAQSPGQDKAQRRQQVENQTIPQKVPAPEKIELSQTSQDQGRCQKQ
jgi:hypothetical protein